MRISHRTTRHLAFTPLLADLIFFTTTTRGASHVGLVIGRDEFVHAPSSRGVVRIESYRASYWADRFVGVRRIVNPESD